MFELSFSNDSIDYQPAINGLDFLADQMSFQIVYPYTRRVPYEFTLLHDAVKEEIKEFTVCSKSSVGEEFPSYSDPSILSSQASIVIHDSEST